MYSIYQEYHPNGPNQLNPGIGWDHPYCLCRQRTNQQNAIDLQITSAPPSWLKGCGLPVVSLIFHLCASCPNVFQLSVVFSTCHWITPNSRTDFSFLRSSAFEPTGGCKSNSLCIYVGPYTHGVLAYHVGQICVCCCLGSGLCCLSV